jgi:hypothetical protein
MRPFVFFKDGQQMVLNRNAISPEHAAAIAICVRTEGVNLFDANGKVIGNKPVMPWDDIQFFRPCFG